MSLTVSATGWVFLAAGVAALARPWLLAWVLSAAAALPATAALTVGDNSVPPFFVVAVLAVPLVLVPFDLRDERRSLRPADQRRRLPLTLAVLLGFAVVAGVITALGPRLFAGEPILLPRGGIDAQIADPTPLAYTASMAAQLGYLVLGVAVVAFVGQRFGAGTRVPEAAFVTGLGLSGAQWLWERTGHTWPRDQFAAYANVTVNRYDPRFHGVFPEPSVLAVFGVASAAYYLLRFGTTRGRARLVPVAMFALSGFVLWLSGSGTAALASAVVAALGYLALAVHVVRSRPGRRSPLVWAGLALPLLAAAGLAGGGGSLRSLLSDKAASGSAEHRFAADRFSLDLLRDTHFLGVGLGANRPSSFLAMLLSCTGVVGTLVFAYLVYRLLRPAVGRPELLASAWALVALLVAKTVAEPSMSTPLLYVLAGALITAAFEPPSATRRTRVEPVARAGGRHRA